MSIQKLDNSVLGKETIPYTQISNKVIQNIKDPYAFLVYSYLLSMPPNWVVIKTQIMDKFGIGSGKIKSIFSYLNRSNLIKYIQERDENGQLLKQETRVLCGDKFKEDEPFQPPKKDKNKSSEIKKYTGGSISRPPVETQQPCGIAADAENDSPVVRLSAHRLSRTTGNSRLQKKYKHKVNKKEKKKEEASLFLKAEKPNQEKPMSNNPEIKFKKKSEAPAIQRSTVSEDYLKWRQTDEELEKARIAQKEAMMKIKGIFGRRELQ